MDLSYFSCVILEGMIPLNKTKGSQKRADSWEYLAWIYREKDFCVFFLSRYIFSWEYVSVIYIEMDFYFFFLSFFSALLLRNMTPYKKRKIHDESWLMRIFSVYTEREYLGVPKFRMCTWTWLGTTRRDSRRELTVSRIYRERISRCLNLECVPGLSWEQLDELLHHLWHHLCCCSVLQWVAICCSELQCVYATSRWVVPAIYTHIYIYTAKKPRMFAQEPYTFVSEDS